MGEVGEVGQRGGDGQMRREEKIKDTERGEERMRVNKKGGGG